MNLPDVPIISVIIPVYNESQILPKLLLFLKEAKDSRAIKEVIISDGQSSDNTLAIAEAFNSNVVVCKELGRAIQLNWGARNATGEILYFLHADSIPPQDFISQILAAHHGGFQAGCFRLQFDWSHWFLKLNAWFTRFNVNALRFGDQSLFITKKLFDKIGGFREDYLIMEDQEIIYRIAKHSEFKVLPDYITTSARKYRRNGVYRMQAIFYYIYLAYIFGASQEKLKMLHWKLIIT